MFQTSATIHSHCLHHSMADSCHCDLGPSLVLEDQASSPASWKAELTNYSVTQNKSYFIYIIFSSDYEIAVSCGDHSSLLIKYLRVFAKSLLPILFCFSLLSDMGWFTGSVEKVLPCADAIPTTEVSKWCFRRLLFLLLLMTMHLE